MRRTRLATVGVALLQLSAVLCMLFPIIWVCLAALRTNTDLNLGGIIPRGLTLNSFERVFAQPVFVIGLRNSLLLATTSALVNTTIALFAAYAVSRLNFRGRKTVGGILLAPQLIPGIVIFIPLVVLIRFIGLANSLPGLAILYLGGGLPLAFWLTRSFLEDLPIEIEDAAMVDGCDRVGVIRHVVFPLMRPALAAVASFVFIGSWGEYMFAVTTITSTESKTLPLALSTLFQLHTVDISLIAAGSVVIALPPAILFLLVQRQLIAGLTAGALGGQ
jgi:ABC-type glycerol-3-phosphate transport system permease component